MRLKTIYVGGVESKCPVGSYQSSPLKRLKSWSKGSYLGKKKEKATFL